MGSCALVASAGRHRGPARGAVDRGQRDTYRHDHRRLRRHVPVGGLNPAQHGPRLPAGFHAHADDLRILSAVRAFSWDRTVVTAGDLV
jgi:hypothetical protein